MMQMAFTVFAGLVLVATASCGGTDPGPQGGGEQQDGERQLGWPSSDNNSNQNDGHDKPRWKNPCPGPACDPYRSHPEWSVDPPPDFEQQRTIKFDPAPQFAPKIAKTR